MMTTILVKSGSASNSNSAVATAQLPTLTVRQAITIWLTLQPAVLLVFPGLLVPQFDPYTKFGWAVAMTFTSIVVMFWQGIFTGVYWLESFVDNRPGKVYSMRRRVFTPLLFAIWVATSEVALALLWRYPLPLTPMFLSVSASFVWLSLYWQLPADIRARPQTVRRVAQAVYLNGAYVFSFGMMLSFAYFTDVLSSVITILAFRLFIWLLKLELRANQVTPTVSGFFVELLAECVTSFAFPNITSVYTYVIAFLIDLVTLLRLAVFASAPIRSSIGSCLACVCCPLAERMNNWSKLDEHNKAQLGMQIAFDAAAKVMGNVIFMVACPILLVYNDGFFPFVSLPRVQFTMAMVFSALTTGCVILLFLVLRPWFMRRHGLDPLLLSAQELRANFAMAFWQTANCAVVLTCLQVYGMGMLSYTQPSLFPTLAPVTW